MRTEVTAFVAKEDADGRYTKHVRYAPKNQTKVSHKKSKLPANFTNVELAEAQKLHEWVEDQFRNIIL